MVVEKRNYWVCYDNDDSFVTNLAPWNSFRLVRLYVCWWIAMCFSRECFLYHYYTVITLHLVSFYVGWVRIMLSDSIYVEKLWKLNWFFYMLNIKQIVDKASFQIKKKACFVYLVCQNCVTIYLWKCMTDLAIEIVSSRQ